VQTVQYSERPFPSLLDWESVPTVLRRTALDPLTQNTNSTVLVPVYCARTLQPPVTLSLPTRPPSTLSTLSLAICSFAHSHSLATRYFHPLLLPKEITAPLSASASTLASASASPPPPHSFPTKQPHSFQLQKQLVFTQPVPVYPTTNILSNAVLIRISIYRSYNNNHAL
jgi:hypothetical protein